MSETDGASQRGFGYINGTFINVYTKENPIKEEGEQCYFLFNSVDNYHVQVIGRGTIIRDWFTEGLNKIYCIRLDEVCENNFFLEKFVWDKEYHLISNVDSHKKTPKAMVLTKRSTSAFLSLNLFRVECFFVRNTIEDIRRLKREYLEIILEDTLATAEDLRYILADNS
jgi:hypothetical protein